MEPSMLWWSELAFSVPIAGALLTMTHFGIKYVKERDKRDVAAEVRRDERANRIEEARIEQLKAIARDCHLSHEKDMDQIETIVARNTEVMKEGQVIMRETIKVLGAATVALERLTVRGG